MERIDQALRPADRRRGRPPSGQAMVEFVFVVFMLLVMLFALIDFARVIFDREVMVNLSREGSNLISRGTSMPDAMTAIFNSANPLNMQNDGYVIMTAVYSNGGTNQVTSQIMQGSHPEPSKVYNGGSITLPVTPNPLPQTNQYLFITEVYYQYQAITPIGKMLNFLMPTNLYDVAYF
jgi:Flp pilus assembly protein TadG